MTDQNNAAQPGQDPLTDQFVNAVIRQHGYSSPEAVIARLWQWIGLNGGENGVTLLMYEAHKALSKLRAEGVQAGDQREAFEAWANNDTTESANLPLSRNSLGDYEDERADGAWQGWNAHARRAALASAPVAGEAQGWSGWACQYPNKLPRLYGAKEIAALNCDTENGDRMLFLSEDAAPQASEADDEEAADAWRRLALQFDEHRMQALGHLRAMLAGPQAHADRATEFLAAPPLSGEQVLADRIAAIAKAPADKDGGDCAKGAGDE